MGADVCDGESNEEPKKVGRGGRVKYKADMGKKKGKEVKEKNIGLPFGGKQRCLPGES